MKKGYAAPTRRLSSQQYLSFNKEIKELSYVSVDQIGFLWFQMWVIAHAYFNAILPEQLVYATSFQSQSMNRSDSMWGSDYIAILFFLD